MQAMRSKLKIAGAIACVSLVLFSTTAQAKLCATPELESALQARMLQTELMVAALYCGSSQQYNAFIKRYGHELVNAGDAIKAAFEREHGKGYKKPWDTWLTKLANNASLRSMDSQGKFCSQTGQIFATLNDAGVNNLRQFASLQSFSTKHGVKTCSPATQTAQRQAATPLNSKSGKGG